MPIRLTPDARTLIRAQRGIVAIWQLEAIGITTKQVRAARRRDWLQLAPRTFLTYDADPTRPQLRVAAALEAGPDAMLAGCSALVEAGWRGSDDARIDVVVARGHRSRHHRAPGWMRLHDTTEVPRREGAPSRTSPVRAAIDAATWARTSRERTFILASAVQQGLVTPAQLRRALRERPRLRHAREMRECLDDITLGVTSTGEADFLAQCRARGLPTPRLQVRHVARGRRRVVDAQFQLPDGRIVIVEIDGIGHMEVGQWQADLRRRNDVAVATGAILLHITTWELRHDPDPCFGLLVDLHRSSDVNDPRPFRALIVHMDGDLGAGVASGGADLPAHGGGHQ